MTDSKTVYQVRTNLGPGELNRLTMEIFRVWMSFAMGEGSLNGKTLKYPTGKYAASIKVSKQSDLSYAIIADDSVPEAGILEVGHPRFDLKTKFQKGRGYPINTPAFNNFRGEVGLTAGYSTFNGYASIGPDSKGWILPPMPAYAPAKILAQLARQAVKAG